MLNIRIYGARTLERYTQGILVKGFLNNGCSITDDATKADAIIFQLHGAPQAESEDRAIIDEMRRCLKNKTIAAKVVILHRPDELKKFPELSKILSSSVQKVGLVFLGDKFIGDTFYSSRTGVNVIKEVIPHGFFDMESARKKLQKDPVVIGSHTSWGEMRSIDTALKILSNVFAMNQGRDRTIIEYLGGKPSHMLNARYLDGLRCSAPGVKFKFLSSHDYDSIKAVLRGNERENIILIDDLDKQPDYFSLTYNIQVYHYGTAIRLGESSGSLHTTVSIPVVIEMNAAEKSENLMVVKIPYSDASDINSIDLREGSRIIIDSIYDRRYEGVLEHNLKQSNIWNSTRIGKEYISLFSQLSGS
jgi:hypothetical protein